ncbi:hypothetical protein LSO07_08155 [Janthinobacterium sp. PLB04]|uniref:Uncharacterized protein n=2 Tax=Janthinobacterium lividum TaxID=29581 RepID=A0AAJ4T728_9BURK|nr:MULTISPECIES: hypothetical protein [Janthinobacterium]KAB0331678.1 hypothetical protein F3B38_08235 [Janthinobacterium lividum]QSX97877.1 hypothetical protein J3P46_08145 [Janthinobacterium lividum]UGQ37837.1 hypothetical protein LSO07_08155 [Janthinobacterium sp. PLB04]
MKRMTKSIVALACGMSVSAGGHAWAQQQASESLPVCQLDPRDSSKLAVEPCRPAPPVQPRRSVAQVIGRMPAQSVPPVVPMAPLSPSPAVPMPRAPQPIGACDTGGCRDSAGTRYNGAGNATLDANGRICHRNGAFIQCF